MVSVSDEEKSVSAAGTSPHSSAVHPVAISINHLSKTYPVPFLRLKTLLKRSFKPPVEALRDVSFEVKTGQIFGLIGRNGAGKTTLTKIIATLVQPTSGTVTVNHHDSVLDDEHVRSQLGLAGAEERSFYWRLTGEQNLLFFARLYGMSDKAAKIRIDQLFSMFELYEVSRRRFGELSTGNKQRLAVARALLSNPPVLLLDEPTRSLDPLAASRMRELIKSLARKDPPATILFTSHNLAEVETLCDRVAIISRGEIKAIDTPENLRALTSNTERIVITVEGLSEAVESKLTQHFAKLEMSRNGEFATLTFERNLEDDKLDNLLRQIQASGGRIKSIQSVGPTLLDVLESYEN
jgi:ABC-2 type transport system ATP-binding protein